MLRRIRRRLRHARRRVRNRRAYGGFYRLRQPHRRRYRRRQILRVVGIVAVVLVALAIWDVTTIARDANAARSKLAGVIGDAQKITDQAGRRELSDRLTAARGDIAAARRRDRISIPLHLAWFVPGLHRSVTGLSQLVSDADAAASLARQSIDDVNASQARLALDEGRVPLDEMQRFAQILNDRSVALRTLVRSPHGMLSRVHSARAEFNDIVGRTSDRLGDASRGLQVGASFLGVGGPRKYMFGFLNNAEMRDSGLVLSYGVATASAGHITFDRTGPINDLLFKGAIALPMPPGLARLFNADYHPREEWRSINATADFAWTGQAAQQMYTKATGDHIDGFVGVDVRALAELLTVLGPVPLDNQQITADNVATVLLHDAYQTDNQEARRERMAALGADIFARLSSGRRDLLGIGRALATATAGGHLKLWSQRADEEDVITRAGLGGTPAATAQTGDQTIHVAVENVSANKLDYYLEPTLDTLVGIDNHGIATLRLRVQLKNTAPAAGQPSYDLGPNINTERPGEYAAKVVVWAPAGAFGTDAVEEAGLDAVAKYTTVEPGKTVTLEFIATLRNAVHDGELRLRFVPQPRLHDVPVSLSTNTVGVHVRKAPAGSFVLSKAVTAIWQL